MKELAERIVKWLQEQVSGAQAKGVIVGLSGGIDSSVVAVLAKKAFPENTLGIIMPCYSSKLDIEYAFMVVRKFNIPTQVVDLTQVLNELYLQLEKKPYTPTGKDVPAANLRPRLRMATLYYFANKLNCLVLGTGNKSEISIGYFTKYGDGGADLLPLGNLLKTEVRELAKILEIPSEIIQRVPTAGLWEGQTDEGEIGITYEELDRTLQALKSGNLKICESESLYKVEELIKKSEHKRLPVPVFEP